MAGRLANDPSTDLTAQLQSLASHDALLGALEPSRKREMVAALTIGIACLTVVSIAWSYRLPVTNISIVVETESATMELAN
jgi:hypothetical protein